MLLAGRRVRRGFPKYLSGSTSRSTVPPTVRAAVAAAVAAVLSAALAPVLPLVLAGGASVLLAVALTWPGPAPARIRQERRR
jgi:hypothetical protein